MPKHFYLALPLLLASVVAMAADPLVGSWLKDGEPAAELRSDHTGLIDSDEIKWTADARILRFTYPSGEKEKMPYTISGNVLTVEMNGKSETFTRSAARQASQKTKASAQKAGKDRLSSLLLSSPWCRFEYNKISGSSHQERVVFRRDGTWDSGARSESHSSGAAGTVAGQTDSSSGGRWHVKGSSLFMSLGGGAIEDTGLSVSRNSNGYPILKTGIKEYSSCN
jgi:hypothetical protein